MDLFNDLLADYFLLERAGGELLAKSYDGTLVSLSILLAILASFTTLDLIYQMRQAYQRGETVYRIWWAAAAVSLGGGIFVMHFVGMLAFSIPVPLRYDFGMTLFSLFIAIAVSAIAIKQLYSSALEWPSVWRGGILMGVGVALMHYSGMAALLAPALLRYLPEVWVASVVIAVVVSVVAILLLHYHFNRQSSLWQRLLIATVMGMAVASMHYTGMVAANFYSGGSCGLSTDLFGLQLDLHQLGLEVGTAAVMVFSLGLISARYSHYQMEWLQQQNQKLEQEVVRRTQITKEQIRELEQLQLALDQHAIVSAADPQGRIIEVNDKFCEVSGYSRKELIGQNHGILKSNEHPPELYQQLWQTITAGEVWEGELCNRKRGGGRYWVKATIVPFHDIHGAINRYVSIRTDITAQIEQERLLLEQQTALANASRAKDEFLAAMSHELRTPLASIIGHTEYLLESQYCGGSDCPLEQANEVLQSIDSSGRNQLALVNDILDMSKIESGKFSIEEAPYDLEQLLIEVERMFELRVRDRLIGFGVTLQQIPEWRLIGDRHRIVQVLTNLLGNAFKFTTDGRVDLTVWHDQRQLYFQVVDSGIGMISSVMARLFQRFEQADGSISRRFGGSGLGLYISRSLVELMGGQIEASSREGEGSTFLLSLPYRESEIAATPPETERALDYPTRLQGRLLLAEDTPELQLMMRRMLESFGLQVRTVNNGEEAVIQGLAHPFDLILMDMQMPLMDGLEATRQLRAEGCDFPIIALTANVMESHRRLFEEAGGSGFIGKPVLRQDMFSLLQQWLPTADGGSEQEPPTESEQGGVEDTTMVDKELMALFVEQNSANRQQIAAALQQQRWEEIRGLAHKIKGSGAPFGFPRLSEVAQQACDAIDRQQQQQSWVEQLLAELDRALQHGGEGLERSV